MLSQQKTNLNLVAFGDSFVEGYIKLPKVNTKKDRKNINFVTKLCTLDNPFIKCENYGIHGASNEKIAYRVYKRCKRSVKNCFFLICWTHPDRVSYYHEGNDEYQTDINIRKVPPKENNFATNMLMFGLHTLLNNLQIPHAQINAFSPLPTEIASEHFTAANYINAEFKRNTLFDIIAERYNKDVPLSEENWNILNQVDIEPSKNIAKCNHPSDEGHTLIANTLNPFLKKFL